MRGLRNLLITAMILTAFAVESQSATPTVINFQGRLTTPGGSPVPDGSYPVVFTIYDAPAGGNIKWTELQSVATSGGSFAVLLGSLVAIPDTVFRGANRYLGTKVGADPELSPRTQLASVPYADRVSTLDSATGGSISGDIRLDNSTALTGNIYKNNVLFIHNSGITSTFVGADAGNFGITGPDNTGVGAGALTQLTSGQQNTAVGTAALFSNTSGEGNVAVGRRSLAYNTGHNNCAIGKEALFFNTIGNGNTAVGTAALAANTADGNTACGMSALSSNAIGLNNAAFGAYSLTFNTDGNGNTANGSLALLNNTSGSLNSAFGLAALHNNSTATGNSAFGDSALYANTTAEGNTAFGAKALQMNVGGTENTATGSGSLRNNTFGSGNTSNGFQALMKCESGNNNTAIGQNSMLGTLNGSQNTAGGANSLTSNVSGTQNTAFGGWAMELNTTGDNNTATGFNALKTNLGGNNNTAVGWNADVSTGGLTNATAIGAGAVVNASNKVRIGNGAVAVIEGQVAFTFTSDKNKKTNFQPVDGTEVLRKISGMTMTSWNYKGQDPARFRHYGPMAQDFFTAFGHDGVGQCGDSITMNSGDQAGILFAAVQALAKQNEQMTAENATLRSEVENLKKMVNQILVQSKADGNAGYSIK